MMFHPSLHRSVSILVRRVSSNFHTSQASPVILRSINDIVSAENEARCRTAFEAGEQDKILCGAHSLFNRKSLVNARQRALHNAGVLLLLCTVNGELSLLYTLRTSHLSSHQGDVSFPGGGSDQADGDIVTTALREAHEEVGINRDKLNVWGCGVSIPSRDLTKLVTPVIAYGGEINISHLKPNNYEVAEIFTVPLSSLCDSRHWAYTRFLIRTAQDGAVKRPSYVMPVFTGGRHKIWGLTALFTYLNLCTLANGLFTFCIRD